MFVQGTESLRHLGEGCGCGELNQECFLDGMDLEDSVLALVTRLECGPGRKGSWTVFNDRQLSRGTFGLDKCAHGGIIYAPIFVCTRFKISVRICNATREVEVETTGHLENHDDPPVPCWPVVDHRIEVHMVFPAAFHNAMNGDGGRCKIGRDWGDLNGLQGRRVGHGTRVQCRGCSDDRDHDWHEGL